MLLELKTISDTFESARNQDHSIVVGSIKPNVRHDLNGALERTTNDSQIGDLEATAGLANVIKSIHILENTINPSNTLFEESSPQIPS